MTYYIPTCLKELPHWTVWRFTKDKDGKIRKKPICVKTGYGASHSDPSTWCDFEKACAAYEESRGRWNKYDGLMFAFTQDMNTVFIDCDHCISDTGELSDIAREVLKMFPGTYSEISVSGKGVHVFVTGTIPKTVKTSEIEMYKSTRFCCVTGNAIRAKEITGNKSDQEKLDYLYQKYKKPDIPRRSENSPVYRCTASDEEIVRRAERQSKFNELYHSGNWEKYYGSQSDADIALCTILAFWSDRNQEIIDRIFRSSKLMRDKWDESHYSDGTTYGEHTIQQSIDFLPESISEMKRRHQFELNKCILSEF